MAENSAIEWTHHTFNPWRGCTKVSPGCKNCYAETLSGRNPGTLGVWGPNGTRVVASEAQWKLPVKWNKQAADAEAFLPGQGRPRVFCASLADVFESWDGPMSVSDGRWLVKPYLDSESGPENWQLEYPESWKDGDQQGWRLVTMSDVRARLFRLIDATPNLDWLVLTKRPENIERMMPDLPCHCRVPEMEGAGNHSPSCDVFKPRPNLWLGTSVENQQAADERIPHLLKVPAAVRFLSCEPLLGPVDLSRLLLGKCGSADGHCGDNSCRTRIDWVIVGGESGPGARPCDVAWIRSIVDQCGAAAVPVFVKQLGSVPRDGNKLIGPYDREEGSFPRCRRCGHYDFGPCSDGTLLCNGCDTEWASGLRDKKGGDPAEWPESLRVREFPTVKAGAS